MENSKGQYPGATVFILDIDGTMIPSGDLDNRCYWQAVCDVLDESGEPEDLHQFSHVTDTGILREWHTRTFGSELRPAVLEAVRARFLELTQQAADEQPESFRPLPGIEDWIGARRGQGCRLAIATGGWQVTAQFKLETSGLAEFCIPVASSDDAVSRTRIMEIALQRAQSSAKVAKDVTYIGDGLWDLRAARELGWDFIGIASGEARSRLLAQGARCVVRDFRQLLP